MSEVKVDWISKGTGNMPKLGDTVKVHYVLSLGEGVSSSNYDYDKGCYVDELIDSTYEAEIFPGPIKITLGNATPKDEIYRKGDSIPGLDSALVDMPVGSKCRLIIPHQLAYGSEGASSFHTFHGYRTPPYKGIDLVVELIEIVNSTNK